MADCGSGTTSTAVAVVAPDLAPMPPTPAPSLEPFRAPDPPFWSYHSPAFPYVAAAVVSIATEVFFPRVSASVSSRPRSRWGGGPTTVTTTINGQVDREKRYQFKDWAKGAVQSEKWRTQGQKGVQITTSRATGGVAGREETERDAAIRRIKAALKRRSGRPWSVTGGRGTVWGWITVKAPPARLGPFGSMNDIDRRELSRLFGEDVHHQGVSIPSGHAYYRAYIERAETGHTSLDPKPYWD